MNCRIAIVGAGFCGLAAAIRLQKKARAAVTVFDGRRPYEKASLIASGIIHPFLGQSSRPAYLYEAALREAFQLFDEVKGYSDRPFLNHHGVIKLALTDQHKEIFQRLVETHPEIKKGVWAAPPLKKAFEGIHIPFGKTIFSAKYLDALENYLKALGGKLIQRQVEDLSELKKEYDVIIVAAGKNSPALLKLEGLKINKGQLLVGRFTQPVFISASLSAKGYISPTEHRDVYSIGSTYEHHFTTPLPTQAGKEMILSDASNYLNTAAFSLEAIHVGFRLTKKINGVPLLKRIDDQVVALTAMGSRGLLYHALMAKYLEEHLFLGQPFLKELEVF
jgi:glycine/D-amino acid oxidase-like deaminating enzyme